MKTLRTRKELFAIANDFKKSLSKERIFDSDCRIYVPLFVEDGSKPIFSFNIEEKSGFVIPVAEFSNIDNKKLFLEFDASNIDGDLDIMDEDVNLHYAFMQNIYFASKEAVETAVKKTIGVKSKKDESDMQSNIEPEYSNEEAIRVKSEEVLKDMNFIKNCDNKNIVITTIGKISVAEISLYDTGCDSFGDVCTNKQVILFFYKTDKYNF